jgi:hypothetical protein
MNESEVKMPIQSIVYKSMNYFVLDARIVDYSGFGIRNIEHGILAMKISLVSQETVNVSQIIAEV